MPVVTLIPNGEGSLTQNPEFYGAATRWQACETDDGIISAVYNHQPATLYDTFTMTDPPAITPSSVTVYAKVFVRVSGFARAATYIKTHGNYYSGALDIISPGGDWDTTISTVYAVNPFTGAAWTVAELTDLEAGIGLLANGVAQPDDYAYCTYVWVEVTYSIPEETGYIWIEGTGLHYIDMTPLERYFEGDTTGEIGTPGYIWVETTHLHYIDENGDERQLTITTAGATAVTPGYLWIEATHLHYIDEDGDEHSQEGTAV